MPTETPHKHLQADMPKPPATNQNLKQRQASEWHREHADFIATYNAIMTTEGLPLEEWRSF